MNNKIKIENLGIETTLEKFVEDWGLDINKINEELEENSCYSDEFFEIEREFSEADVITVRIPSLDESQGESLSTLAVVNSVYDDYYLFVIKDVYFGEIAEACEVCDGEGWDDEDDEECKSCEGEGGDYGELNYTSFNIENSTPKTNPPIVFKGGEYNEKSILNEDELSKFYNQMDEGKIDYTTFLKYQEVWFVKEEDLIRNGWGKTIKSFNLYDWKKYPFEPMAEGDETDIQVKESLDGKSIVISGVFEKYSRKELKAIIEKGGGKASSAISKNTSFILAGDKMGPSKKEKAIELNIEMIGEEEFIKKYIN